MSDGRTGGQEAGRKRVRVLQGCEVRVDRRRIALPIRALVKSKGDNVEVMPTGSVRAGVVDRMASKPPLRPALSPIPVAPAAPAPFVALSPLYQLHQLPQGACLGTDLIPYNLGRRQGRPVESRASHQCSQKRPNKAMTGEMTVIVFAISQIHYSLSYFPPGTGISSQGRHQ